MLTRRVIACLDVKGDRVVKGTRFVGLRDVGDPVELAMRYEAEGADEICFLDISATPDERATAFDVVRRTAERLFVPLTLGGGIREVGDVANALRAGADKVSVNTAAVERPGILTEAAARFGSQCVVASIDARREGDGWRVWTHGGRRATELDAVRWAVECARLGAGEILLTSIDADGGRQGYDLALTRTVSQAVRVPVIASGGAGAAVHLVEAVLQGEADAVLLAGLLHDGFATVGGMKSVMRESGVAVRIPA
ncbi:MAG: imidazole glycerol phosphate synthase subunit HisF [Candidatus Eisenbacteria bacterium]|jgi:imidazole glycerol-phosphate synthase subunit HisF